MMIFSLSKQFQQNVNAGEKITEQNSEETIFT
jgi:hypothetical protein